MQKIKRLSKQMTNLIAAGEVVERPASAVKELIENSMDAGADIITVEIKNGGVTLIRVTDNGSGIPADELETAFLRYATSKISEEEDLSHIRTMGFRGEALAAIAAVSKVTMLTKTRESDIGAKITLEGGVVTEKSEAGCPDGTTIIVADLFYNTPARHKFLKKDSSEAGYIQSVCQRAAMCRPDISFKLIRDGDTIVHTPGDGSFFSVLYCIFGKAVTSGLAEVDYAYENCRAYGYVSKPYAARQSRTMQHFLVNGRPVKSLLLQSAAEEAFRGKIVTGKYPACFLSVTVPEESIDVNVHPAKTEVKFAFERAVFDTVYYGVKNALDAENPAARIVLSDKKYSYERPEPEKPKTAVAMPLPEEKENVLPLRSNDIFTKELADEEIYKKHKYSTKNYGIIGNATTENAAEAKEIPAKKTTSEIISPLSTLPDKASEVSQCEEKAEEKETEEKEISYSVLGEIFGVYILISCGDELLIMDKHAAHERIKYEELKQDAGACAPQTLLDPPVVTLRAEDKAVIIENKELLYGIGFEIDDFGGGSVIVRAVPDIYAKDSAEEAEDALNELAQKLKSGRGLITQKRDELLQMMACKSAIKSGDRSDRRELERLADSVLRNNELRNCPHGRPIYVSLGKTELEKYFKRIV